MLQLTTLVRSILAGSLGNAGAVANAQAALHARTRDEWVVEGLARRLAPAGSDAPAAPAASEPAAA